MRSFKYIGFLFLSLLVPFQVKALGTSISLSCDKTTLKALESTTCTISGTSSGEVSTMHLEVDVDSSLELGTITASSIWQKDIFNGEIDLYTDTNKTGNFDIASFVVKAKDMTGVTPSVRVSNVFYSDENFDRHNISGASKTFKIPSNNNNLSNLSVSGASITFSKDTTIYNVEVDSSSVTINGTLEDSKASVSGLGTKSLNYGKNTYKVVVKSESGISKTYTLNITRKDNRSSNNKIESFSVSDCKFTFSPNKTSYSLNVDNKVSKVTLTGKLSDEKSSFVDDYGLREVVLKEGNNVILVKVKAENESVLTYTFNIYRKANKVDENKDDNKDDKKEENVKSTDNRLKILTLSKGSLNFDPEVLEYSVTLPSETKEVIIDGDTNDSKATLTGLGKKTLKIGDNKFEVIVTSESGKKRTYKINITVSSESKDGLDADNDLSILTVTGYDFIFSKDQFLYELTFNGKDSLDISATPASEVATVTIMGNEDLKVGDEISIVVTAENGDNQTYRIVLIEEEANLLIPILIGVGVLVVVTVVTIVVIKTRKKDTKDITIGE